MLISELFRPFLKSKYYDVRNRIRIPIFNNRNKIPPL